MSHWVILTPLEDVRVYGPFDSEQQAVDWAERNFAGDDWTVKLMIFPA